MKVGDSVTHSKSQLLFRLRKPLKIVAIHIIDDNNYIELEGMSDFFPHESLLEKSE